MDQPSAPDSEAGGAKRRNQHKPCVPADLIRTKFTHYYTLGLTDAKIAKMCHADFDTDLYGLSESSVKRLRKEWNLKKTRQQKHTLQTIHPYAAAVKERFPQSGAQDLTNHLRITYNIRVPRPLVLEWLRTVEPEAVAARKHRKFRRHRFWAAGVNDVWAFDQHDKWGRFGLYLHVGVEPVAGEIKWLKIWWNNSNPRIVTSYYIEAVRKLGAIPLVTQSDPGTENFGIANAHTYMRHSLDPSLTDTLQHRWMRRHMNVKPEILWSVLNRGWKPGFEAQLQYGVDHGWYDPSNPLESLVFRWLAIPWLQAELDAWAAKYNMTSRRSNRHKVLPHGIPVLIAQRPQDYNVSDFKVAVPPELVDEVEQQWAPEAHPIFQLVDPVIGEKIDLVFTELGSPEVTSQSFWPVYLQVLHGMLVNQQLHPEQQAHCAAANQSAERFAAEPIILLPGLRDLREGDTVVGAASGSGAPAGGIQEEPLGFFSDEEYDEDEAGFF